MGKHWCWLVHVSAPAKYLRMCIGVGIVECNVIGSDAGLCVQEAVAWE